MADRRRSMSGVAGTTFFWVDSFADVVLEDSDGGSADEVRTTIGSRTDTSLIYVLPENVERLTGLSSAPQGVSGNTSDNIINMGPGGDLIVIEQGGIDIVNAGGGNDFIYAGGALTAADQINGGAGTDTVGLLGVYNLTLSETTLAAVETLAVYSSGGAGTNSYSITTVDPTVAAGQYDVVIGLSLLSSETLMFNGSAELDGSFNIRGGHGADTLTGGAGADQIYGNLGADMLRGGAGNDSFEYLATTESTPAATDVIFDFTRGDKINLVPIDADGNAQNGNSAFSWIGAAAFGNQSGQLRASQHPENARTWVVEADVNGDGTPELTLYVYASSASFQTRRILFSDQRSFTREADLRL
jgi:Ca2+-binding RTX toxin-like protein